MEKILEIAIILLILTSPWTLTLLSIIIEEKARLISFKKGFWHIHRFIKLDEKPNFISTVERCDKCGKVNVTESYM